MKIVLVILIAFSLAFSPVAIPAAQAQSNNPLGDFAGGVAGGVASCFAGYIAGVLSSAVSQFVTSAATSAATTSLIGGIGLPVYDASAHVRGISAGIQRGAILGTNTNLLMKECVIDPLIAGIVQLIREQVLQRIFRYVGGDGSPAFVQRFISRLQNLGRRVADEQLRILIVHVNEEWRREFEQELSRELFTPPEQKFVFDAPSCTNIDGAVDNGETFDSGNYIGGGGSACLYERVKKYKANIPVTTYAALRNSIADASFDAQDIEKHELVASGGYKANQECIEVPVPNGDGTLGSGEFSDSGTVGSGNTVEYCYNVTPGSTIKAIADEATLNPLHQLNLADEIGEIIRLLVLDIINYALGLGLSEINNAIGGQPSYTSQLGDPSQIQGGALIEAGVVTSSGSAGGTVTGLQGAAGQSVLSARVEIENYLATERGTLAILTQALTLVDGISGEEELRDEIEAAIAIVQENIRLAEQALTEIAAIELQFSQAQDLSEIGSILYNANQITLTLGISSTAAELQRQQAEELLQQAQIAAGVISAPTSGGSGGGSGSITGPSVGTPIAPTPGNASGIGTSLWNIPMGQNFLNIANATWWDARTANLRFPDGNTVRVQFDSTTQNTRGGIHGFFRIPDEYTSNGERACLGYTVTLQDGFPHADPSDNSCKLPGFGGGEIQYAGGGRLSDDKRAFSARLGISSWYTRDYIVTPYYYLRWSRQPTSNGIEPSFGVYGYGQRTSLASVNEISGEPARIVQCVTMNTNDQPNGNIQVWINGTLRHENTDVYITDGSFGIDYVFMSHFCNQPVPGGTFTDFTDMQILDPNDLFDGSGSPLSRINA